MKLLQLLLGSIVVFGVLVNSTSGYDATPDVLSEVIEAPPAEIEDQVAEVMDALEVLTEKEESAIEDGQLDQVDEQGENIDEIAAEEVNPVQNQEEESQSENSSDSESDEFELELMEEARDNKFTFLSLFHGKYYESYYQKINNYLVDKLEENDNTKDNMEVALNWLQSLEKSSSFKDKNLIQALKQLTALTMIGGDNMCTKNSYGILRKNDLATRGNGHRRRTKLGAMRRVDKMVYEYSIQHAIDCFHQYPDKFANKRARLDQNQLSYVEPLFDKIFQTVLRPANLLGLFTNPNINKNIDPTELVRDITSLDRADVGEATLEKLRFYARNDPQEKYLDYINDDRSAKYIIREDKVKELYEKYIVKPCEYYIKRLGFDILIPMRFDLQMLEPEDRYLLNSDQLIDFYSGYARFRACNLLVYQDRKALARHIVKAVYKQSQP